MIHSPLQHNEFNLTYRNCIVAYEKSIRSIFRARTKINNLYIVFIKYPLQIEIDLVPVSPIKIAEATQIDIPQSRHCDR